VPLMSPLLFFSLHATIACSNVELTHATTILERPESIETRSPIVNYLAMLNDDDAASFFRCVETRQGGRVIGIKRDIRQIWFGEKPESIQRLMATWDSDSFRQQHVGWTHSVYSDDELKLLGLINADLMQNEKSNPPDQHSNIARSDLLRLELLWQLGGVYVDSDAMWTGSRSFDDLLALPDMMSRGFFVAPEPRTDVELWSTGVIGAAQHHPIVLFLIAKIRATYVSCRLTRRQPCWVCFGPLLVTSVLRPLGQFVVVLPSYFFYPISWRVADEKTFDRTKYPLSFTVDFGHSTNIDKAARSAAPARLESELCTK
jgi:hypothetical protein